MKIRKKYDDYFIEFDIGKRNGDYVCRVIDDSCLYEIITTNINNIIKISKECERLYKNFLDETRECKKKVPILETFYHYSPSREDYVVDPTFFISDNKTFSRGMLNGKRFKYMVNFLAYIVELLYNDINVVKDLDIILLLFLTTGGKDGQNYSVKW